MKRLLHAVAVIMLIPVADFALAQTASRSPAPVNPEASTEARALLNYLDSISGKFTMTGQHNFPNDGSRWTDRAYDLTGKYPALFGEDFGFAAGDDKDSIESRPAMIAEVKRQYQNGSVITLTWHAVRPTDDEPVTFRDSVQGHLTDFEWHELLTPGTELNRRWCAQVDVIAGYLQQLRDAHVPVLFRPYHEVNGNWFWWGGRPGRDGSAALYRQLYDRFVNLHHLDNLVWVWNVNAPGGNAGPVTDYYPGAKYADLLTIDVYGEFKPEYQTDMLALADGKPVALGEVGAAPTPDILATQPAWTYFMIWSSIVDSSNTPESLKAIYNAPSSLVRDDPRLAAPMSALRKSSGLHPDPQPVSSASIPAVKALLAKLYAATGQTTLSGQANLSQNPTAATEIVHTITGRRPAIYATDLGAPSAKASGSLSPTSGIIEEAKRQQQGHAIVALTWHAPSPADDGASSQSEAPGNQSPPPAQVALSPQLTDFEWNELLTPGTHLNKRWAMQVDSVAATLKQLQAAGVAVLWTPYPDLNGKTFWWAGRKGSHGSAALYRQLFDRLVNQDGIHNLVWIWEAEPPSFGSNASGAFSDYFPGLLYVDALSLETDNLSTRFRTDIFLSRFAVGKPIGLSLNTKIPPPESFVQQRDWTWFIVSDAAIQLPETSEPLRNLYQNPQIVSLPVQ